MNQRSLTQLLVLSFFVTLVGHILGQGSLIPSGPPGPTMSTLDQISTHVDVRTPITEASTTFPDSAYTITQPGSYYLVANVNIVDGRNGINIVANNVTLDLNGFVIQGGGSSGTPSGIVVTNVSKNIRIRNGTVTGWLGNGVSAQNANSSVVESINSSDNAGFGMAVGIESVVRNCTMTGNTSYGLLTQDRALVSGCVANVNSTGILAQSNCQIIDCICERNLHGTGISIGDQGLVNRCAANFNSTFGISTNSGTVISDSVINFNGDKGVFMFDGSSVRNCSLKANRGDGISCAGNGCLVVGNILIGNAIDLGGSAISIPEAVNCRVDGNTAVSNLAGINVNSGNLVVRNIVGASTAPGGNYPTSDGAGHAAVYVAGARFVITDPWANFEQ